MSGTANLVKLLLASSSLVAMPVVAHAQAKAESAQSDAADSGIGVGDIIVTARKVSEPLSKAPVAVTAFTQEQMRTKEIRNPQDLNAAVPSLLVSGQFAGGRDVAQYSIRGMGAAGGPVALYFAGAPGGGGQQQFYDLANVQVIPGQQGTLFGRTSTSGAILFEPNRPTNEFDGFVQAGIGTLDYSRLEGMINVPIAGDAFAVRVAGFVLRRAGYTTSLDTGQDLDNQHRESFRIGVKIKPFGDVLDNYTVFQYNNFNESGIGSVLQAINPAALPSNGVAFGSAIFGRVCAGEAARYGLAGSTDFINGCVAQRGALYDGIKQAAIAEHARIAAGAQGGIRSARTSGLQSVKGRSYSLVNNSLLSLGDAGPVKNIAIKNIFSYQWGEGTYGRFEDTDGIAPGYFDSTGVNFSGPQAGTCVTSGAQIGQCTLPVQSNTYSGKPPSQVSEEINLSGRLFDRLDLLAGYFYLKSTSYASAGGSNIYDNVLFPGRAPRFNTRTIGGNSREEGAFINGALDLGFLIPHVKVSAGFRRTTTSSLSTTEAVAASYPTASTMPTIVSQGFTTARTHETGSNRNFSIDWTPTDRILIYARSGTGFTPGGSNVACAGTDIPTPCPTTYNKQSAKDYELGAKVQWNLGDVRLNTNFAMYRTDFTDIVQQRRETAPVAGTPVLYNVNAPSARIDGLELVQTLRYKSFGAQITYSYTDSKYNRYYEQNAAAGYPCTKVDNSANDCLVLSGQRLIASVKNRIAASADWTLPLPESIGQVTPSLQVSYSSSANYGRTLQQDPYTEAPGYTLVHGRIDWRNAFGHPVDVSVFVRNVFNTTYVTYIAPLYSIFGYNTAQYGEPRTGGIELRYRFGAGSRR